MHIHKALFFSVLSYVAFSFLLFPLFERRLPMEAFEHAEIGKNIAVKSMLARANVRACVCVSKCAHSVLGPVYMITASGKTVRACICIYTRLANVQNINVPLSFVREKAEREDGMRCEIERKAMPKILLLLPFFPREGETLLLSSESFYCAKAPPIFFHPLFGQKEWAEGTVKQKNRPNTEDYRVVVQRNGHRDPFAALTTYVHRLARVVQPANISCSKICTSITYLQRRRDCCV